MANQKQSEPSIRDLFAAALEYAPEQRPAFLRAACAHAPENIPVIDEMLAAHDRAGSFLNSPLFAPGTEPTLEDLTAAHSPHSNGDASIPPRFHEHQVIAGRFHVVRFIDRGGMGEVYEVRDDQVQDDLVALKVIRSDIAASAGSGERFEREVLLARKVHHSNLCPIYDLFRCDDADPPFLCLNMKLLRGETLDARLKSTPPLPLNQRLDICTQLIRGVGAMHAAGVLHRDLKPNNIMLEHTASPGGDKLCVYIMDFGLARLHKAELSLTGLAGTPGYIAPELILEGQQPTQATDLYALGVVLHQVLTGHRPGIHQQPQQNAQQDSHQRALAQTNTPALGQPNAPALAALAAPPDLLEAVQDLISKDPEDRIRAFESLHASVDSNHPTTYRSPRRLLTRRTFLASTGATACVLAGGALWRRNQIYDWAHPLPPKRFVAVLNWLPTKDPKIRPMVSGLLDAIANELSRAEAYDHKFFITTQRQTTELNTAQDLVEASESLGTNLVLAVSATTVDNHLHILLRVLDPSTTHTLRARDLHTTLNDLFSLPQRAVHLAADLLDVNHYQPDDQRNRTGTDNPEAYQAFQAAELLRKQDNDTGLDPAIEKYKDALELDPHYALAQARLGWAYLRSYGIHKDGATLALAKENCESAIALDPNIVDAHLGLGWALEQSGDHDAASREMSKALSLDPSNAHTLIYQAHLYSDNGQYSLAEDNFERALKLRPNLWFGHSDYGALLYNEGKYQAALLQFRLASVTAPKSSLAYGNIGNVYLQMGDLDDAIKNSKTSFHLDPNDDAADTLAAAFRISRHFTEAIAYAQQAVRLNPASSANWLELGDSYSASGQPAANATAAYREAVRVEEEELRTEPKNGLGWMLLALCRTKAGDPSSASGLISKAESFSAQDITSQLVKIRTLALLGKRDDCLTQIALCLKRGATIFQFQTMPDLETVRDHPRYAQILNSISGTGQSTT